ncbi:hypothetical protein FNV43_RR25640 [Rhamnella rubrinervis]|uniref:Protein TSSC4 n=1 Tax=Rhamnella rubrinervis TaxID=2594499 RepID=A0A8K0DHE0_9ROSA|nr:hypothetical protein FNV43_RR25640 [Rhamnella rubrinervis]
MDDSFRLRVEKVFGSLASSPSSSLKSSLWSITDDEVKRREWRRPSSGTSEMPCSSSFDEHLKKDRGISRRTNFSEDELEGLDEGDEDRDEELDGPLGRGQDDQDEWSIRSSIGLDCTLDYEEEEDEFDKVACGRENAGDRLYMGDVRERKSYLNSYNVLPNPLHGTVKDPRANHLAAKARLKEDEDEASMVNSNLACAADIKEPYVKSSKDDTPRPKSILKRRFSEANSKSQKRVRFNLGSKTDCEGESNVLYYGSQIVSGIPDFAVNPSKFSCYTSDSSEDDTIAQSCRNVISQVKSFGGKSGSELDNGLADLPKSATSVSERKSSDSKAVNDGSEVKQNKEGDGKQSVFPVGVAAGGEAEDEVGTAVEDDKTSHF